jgi:hypothetical protein
MKSSSAQPGMTPPDSGPHKEEPEFRTEDDIPTDDRASASQGDDADSHPQHGERDD